MPKHSYSRLKTTAAVAHQHRSRHSLASLLQKNLTVCSAAANKLSFFLFQDVKGGNCWTTRWRSHGFPAPGRTGHCVGSTLLMRPAVAICILPASITLTPWCRACHSPQGASPSPFAQNRPNCYSFVWPFFFFFPRQSTCKLGSCARHLSPLAGRSPPLETYEVEGKRGWGWEPPHVISHRRAGEIRRCCAVCSSSSAEAQEMVNGSHQPQDWGICSL